MMSILLNPMTSSGLPEPEYQDGWQECSCPAKVRVPWVFVLANLGAETDCVFILLNTRRVREDHIFSH